MKLPNNGWDRAPIKHLSSPNEVSSTGNGKQHTALLAKRDLWRLLNKYCCCQGYTLLSTKQWQFPIAEDNIHTTYWTWGNPPSDYLIPFPLWASSIGRGTSSSCSQRRKVKTNQAANPLNCNGVPPVRCAGAMVAEPGRSNQNIVWYDPKPTPWDRNHMAWMPTNLRLNSPVTLAKPFLT